MTTVSASNTLFRRHLNFLARLEKRSISTNQAFSKSKSQSFLSSNHLYLPRSYRRCSDTATTSSSVPNYNLSNKLAKIIEDTIKATGPIPVSQYIQLCLSHPTEGYYMKNEVFGAKGDFITSPEITQVFGELVGIWLLSRWLEDGMPSKVRLVELGPGRGTLVDDILRTLLSFKKFAPSLSTVELVETSERLRNIQEEKLQKHGVTTRWHTAIDDLESDGTYTLFVAHEFFDALPIHILQKTERGFRELLVGLSDKTTLVSRPLDLDTTLLFEPKAQTLASQRFNWTLSPGLNPIASVLSASSSRFSSLPTGGQVEISPASWAIANKIGSLLYSNDSRGGAGLIIDYGDDRYFGNSFRAFRKHKIVDVFEDPGSADLTTNVDFAYLREAMSRPGLAHGLASQRDFLLKMGIEVRTKSLLSQAAPERQADINKAVSRLIDPSGMGSQYKFLAVTKGRCPYPFEVEEPKVKAEETLGASGRGC